MKSKKSARLVLITLAVLIILSLPSAMAQNSHKSSQKLLIEKVNRQNISLDDLVLISVNRTAPPNALNQLFRSANVKVIGTIGKDDLLLYEILCRHNAIHEATSRLKRSTLVRKVLRNIKFYPAYGPTPNDPDYSKQYHLRAMKAPQAWDENHNGQHVPIAIFDTGCAGNSDLSGHMYQGYDAVEDRQNAGTTDPNGHGSMVATTAAALMGNFKGGTGVAYSSTIMPIKIANANGAGYLNAILRGIDYCANWDGGPSHEKISIINISYSNLMFNGPDSEHVELHKKFKWFHDKQKGLIFVAAGNEGRYINAPKQPYLAVVSANENGNPGKLAKFSNYGDSIWFNAPGTKIVCMDHKGQTVTPDGTSLACPIVAAMAANLWSHALASNLKIEQMLKNYCVLPDGTINNGLGSDNKWDNKFGYGMPGYNPTTPPDHGDKQAVQRLGAE